jgi:hypothetical protein
VFDYHRNFNYIVEMVHDSHLDGWLRFLTISMETTATPTLKGFVRIPWHLATEFTEQLEYFAILHRSTAAPRPAQQDRGPNAGNSRRR